MLTLVLTIALSGFLVWLAITYIPMPDAFKKTLIVLVIIVLIIYLFRALGFHDIPVR